MWCIMALRARLLPFLLLLAAILAAPPTHAQQRRPSIKYTIVDNDSLWIIATLYYNAPTAAVALYNHNRAVLDAANKTHPKGADWIFPNTVIDLPDQIESGDIRYTRREAPMDRSLAEAVGRPGGIGMAELLAVTRKKILPKYTSPIGNVQAPFNKHASVSRGPKAARERAPAWFNKPDSSLERCAKSVCTRFEQLCFFECLAISKRLSDGDRLNICERLQQRPHDMSVQLPYEVDEETRDNCAELVQ
jgi:hypothetical protein